jgi:hypothetical protein
MLWKDLRGTSGHPFAEAAISKDKWIAPEEELVIHPPVDPKEVPEVAQVLLSGVVQEEPVPNPEIEGGQIVLIAQNNNTVQRPSQTLDTMHASRSKQNAFNRRILKVEDEISGINSDLAQFVQKLSPDPANPIYVCVNDGASMRGSQPIGGQYWRQGNLQMAATNQVCYEADSSRESVALSAVCDAIAWRHALEINSDLDLLRTQQRVIVYPTILKGMMRILESGDCRTDPDGGRESIYPKIAEEFHTYAYPPVLLCEDSPATKEWPGLSEHVAEWMKVAELIAVGSFRQVKEDGRDVMSSESDSENSDHGEQWEDRERFTSEMIGEDGKRIMCPVKLSRHQVAVQMAQHKDATTKVTPVTTPVNSDDEEEMTEDQKRYLASAKRRASRAGGQGTATGLGKTHTRVSRSHPSKT